MSNARESLGRFLGGLTTGQPVEVGGVAFRPLIAPGPVAELPLDLLEEALAGGGAAVSETGAVAELELTSTSDRRTLVLEGDIVRGGRQNRTFNQTFVLAPRARLRAPTSCVEQGRWSGDQVGFGCSGSKVSPTVSATLKRSVTETMTRTGGTSRRSDQHGVWEEAASTLALTSTGGTSDLLAAYAKQREEVAGRLEALRPMLALPGLVGVLVARPRGAGALEAFATPRLAGRVLERVLTSHLLVPEAPGARPGSPPPLDLTGDETLAPGLGGLGEELRIVAGALCASAFVLDGRTLHVGADWAATS